MEKNKKQFFNIELPALKPVQIIEHEVTEERFISIFSSVHGQDGATAYEKEKFYFSKIIVEKPAIGECTPLSLFSVFLDIATKGLTLDNSSKALCHITSRNIPKKTGKYVNNKPEVIWEKRAILDISGYGELVLRERAGQVKYADNPEVVYLAEQKKYKEENSPEGKRIFHTIEYPRPQDSGILLIYVRIVRPDGSVTFGTLDNEGIERLKNYSAENNGKWEGPEGKKVKVKGEPNKLYDDIGFLKAKCLKHAFQSFPKLKLNNFSAIVEGPEIAEELGLKETTFEPLTKNEPFEVVNILENVTVNSGQEGITVEDNNNIF